MNKINFIIVVCILIAVSVIGYKSYLPARFDAALENKVDNFPKVIGEWSSTDIPVSEQDYQILETRNLFVRDYKNALGESVYLYVIYSEDNRKVSHPPEICLMGSGLSIADKSAIQISDTIKAVQLIVERTDTRELVAYWYKAGNLYTDKYLRQQLKIVMDRTLGKRTSGALIRLSTDIKDDDPEAALNLIKTFSAQIEPLLAKHLP